MLDKRVRRKPSVAARRLGEETAIVSAERSMLHVLTNEVASRIWELADGSHTGQEICERLCREFEVEPAEAAADLRWFLEEMERQGLIDLQENDVAG